MKNERNGMKNVIYETVIHAQNFYGSMSGIALYRRNAHDLLVY
jgi:hypothetical protein